MCVFDGNYFQRAKLLQPIKMCVGENNQIFTANLFFLFFLNLGFGYEITETPIKSRIAPLGLNKKGRCAVSMPRAYRSCTQLNISSKLITTSLLFLYNSDNNNVHTAILGRQSFQAVQTVQDFHFLSRGIIVGRMRKTSSISNQTWSNCVLSSAAGLGICYN